MVVADEQISEVCYKRQIILEDREFLRKLKYTQYELQIGL